MTTSEAQTSRNVEERRHPTNLDGFRAIFQGYEQEFIRSGVVASHACTAFHKMLNSTLGTVQQREAGVCDLAHGAARVDEEEENHLS